MENQDDSKQASVIDLRLECDRFINEFIEGGRMFTAFEVYTHAKASLAGQDKSCPEFNEVRRHIRDTADELVRLGAYRKTKIDVGTDVRPYLYHPEGADVGSYVPLNHKDPLLNALCYLAVAQDASNKMPVMIHVPGIDMPVIVDISRTAVKKDVRDNTKKDVKDCAYNDDVKSKVKKMCSVIEKLITEKSELLLSQRPAHKQEAIVNFASKRDRLCITVKMARSCDMKPGDTVCVFPIKISNHDGVLVAPSRTRKFTDELCQGSERYYVVDKYGNINIHVPTLAKMAPGIGSVVGQNSRKLLIEKYLNCLAIH